MKCNAFLLAPRSRAGPLFRCGVRKSRPFLMHKRFSSSAVEQPNFAVTEAARRLQEIVEELTRKIDSQSNAASGEELMSLSRYVETANKLLSNRNASQESLEQLLAELKSHQNIKAMLLQCDVSTVVPAEAGQSGVSLQLRECTHNDVDNGIASSSDEKPNGATSKRTKVQVSKPKTKPKQLPRLPYHLFRSHSGMLIKVGRTAADNDLLSCDEKHRHDADMWLHAEGCSGSHVVVVTEQGRLIVDRETKQDAAFLAALHSSSKSTVRAVHVTTCRNVHKYPGDKPGLVHLRGSGAETVTVHMTREVARQQRLHRDGFAVNTPAESVTQAEEWRRSLQ